MGSGPETSLTIKIAIAEDDDVYRHVICKKIEAGAEFSVRILARNGIELIEQLEQTQGSIDICILDLGMHLMNGYETLPILRKKWPSMRVLVLSAYSREYSILSVLEDGACGFLAKRNTNDLIEALKSIYHDGYYYSEQAPEEMFKKVQKIKRGFSEPSKKEFGLSKKEMEVLNYLCTKDSYADIAKKMFISKRTLEVHRDNIFRKFDVHSRSELIIFILEHEMMKIQPS